MNNETVDLIVTDPPFKNRGTWVGKIDPPLSKREREHELACLRDWGITNEREAQAGNVDWPSDQYHARYNDIWLWQSDVDEDWMERIADVHPKVNAVIEMAVNIHDVGRRPNQSSIAAYLAFMAVRLIEMHRVLKPTGTLFLHCDYTANSYLRVLLDAIFGCSEPKNEIAWCYRGGGVPKDAFARKHDTILSYTKGRGSTFNKQYVPYSEASRKLVASRGGVSIDDRPRDLKRGAAMPDWWIDINSLQTWSPERSGYPTQKPVALAERIIAAASNPGDLVFDPFAGCAYVPVAAELLDRQWLACDVSPRAMTIIERQYSKPWQRSLNLDETSTAEPLDFSKVVVRGPSDIPTRTDEDPPVVIAKPQPQRIYRRSSVTMPKHVQKAVLARLSDWACWACGYKTRAVDGTPLRVAEQLELDHISPKSAGGSQGIHNKALLCRVCNQEKAAKLITIAALRRRDKIRERRRALGVKSTDLVDTDALTEQAIEEDFKWRTSQGTV